MAIRTWTFWFRLGLAAVTAGLAASWEVGSLLTLPTPAIVAPARPPAVDLPIETGDGLLLAATYWPGRRADAPGLLLLHGNGSSRAAMRNNASWLASRGYAVLTIDFRGHGQSSSAPHSFGLHESRDAAAAFAWLKRRQRNAPVAVIGASLGGAAALLGAQGPLPADAMVLQAVYPDIRHAIRNRIAATATPAAAYLLEPLLSYQSWPRLGVGPGRLSPIAALRHYRGPVLIVGGGEDRDTPPAETRAMFRAAPGRKSLWIVPGLGHARTADISGADYKKRLLAFLRATIGDPR
ncbi:MAG TPA: alpha/beta fold hydrolase [Allosphingosinicella sp.]|nr:alpha/beta fold hydrolase [Allosphingosinicella sp.]